VRQGGDPDDVELDDAAAGKPSYAPQSGTQALRLSNVKARRMTCAFEPGMAVPSACNRTLPYKHPLLRSALLLLTCPYQNAGGRKRFAWSATSDFTYAGSVSTIQSAASAQSTRVPPSASSNRTRSTRTRSRSRSPRSVVSAPCAPGRAAATRQANT
jgi:hypothetical protein